MARPPGRDRRSLTVSRSDRRRSEGARRAECSVTGQVSVRHDEQVPLVRSTGSPSSSGAGTPLGGQARSPRLSYRMTNRTTGAGAR